MWNIENQTIELDERGRGLFGMTEGSGTTFAEFFAIIHPDDRDATLLAVHRAVENHSNYDMIHRVVWPDKSIHWLRCFGGPDAGDRRNRLIGVTIEVTWLERTESLLRANERLVAEATLAHALAHEINNPLEILGNSLYLLATSSPSPEQQRFLTMSQKAYKRIEQITRQMFAIHLRSQEWRQFSFSDCLEEVVEKYSEQAHARNIVMDLRCDKAVVFSGAESDIHQLIRILLENAIHAVPDGGRIVIRARNSRDWSRHARRGLRLLVADNGSGVPPDLRSTLFQPFKSTRENAAGMGLWICNLVARRYGGSIRFRSSVVPGQSGTSISLFLRSLPDFAGSPPGPQRVFRSSGY
jgi:signal transduction histidine kinase